MLHATYKGDAGYPDQGLKLSATLIDKLEVQWRQIECWRRQNPPVAAGTGGFCEWQSESRTHSEEECATGIFVECRHVAVSRIALRCRVKQV